MMLDDGVFIPQGTYLGYNCYSTNRNPEAWGPDADQFRPQRWGDTFTEIQKTYRRRRSRSEFITFHGGRRACLGEKFALLELKATLFVLCRELRWKLDPTWADKLTPVSGLTFFILPYHKRPQSSHDKNLFLTDLQIGWPNLSQGFTSRSGEAQVLKQSWNLGT